jgi:C-terminal processing protease CtpA/Prc
MKPILAALMLVPLAFITASCGHKLDEPPGVRAHVVLAGGESRSWLGVSLDDVTPRLARKKDLRVDEGAYVRSVEDESPADDAGIREGDVIVEFDGKKVADSDDLIRAVRKTDPGTEVSIVVMRGAERKTLTARIGKRPPEPRVFSFRVPPIPPMPQFHVSRSVVTYGLRVETLNKQLAEYFGAPEGKGVLVKSVKRDSPGDKAGFRAGDVIIKVGKSAIADVDDLLDAFDDYRKEKTVDVEILRKGQKQLLSLQLQKGDEEVSEFDADAEVDIALPHDAMRMGDEIGAQIKEQVKKLKALQDAMLDRIKELQKKLRKELDRKSFVVEV